jgi:hypothetical protein
MSLDLGPYANDPRILNVSEGDGTGDATIETSTGYVWTAGARAGVWLAKAHSASKHDRAHRFSCAQRALQFLLDEPIDIKPGQIWEALRPDRTERVRIEFVGTETAACRVLGLPEDRRIQVSRIRLDRLRAGYRLLPADAGRAVLEDNPED